MAPKFSLGDLVFSLRHQRCGIVEQRLSDSDALLASSYGYCITYPNYSAGTSWIHEEDELRFPDDRERVAYLTRFFDR